MDMTARPPDDEMSRLVVEALVDSETEPAPQPLRQKVLAGALRQRPAGRPAATETISPVEACRRTIDELDDLLAGCEPDDWSARVEPYGWSVQGLVGHLLGIERMLATRLGIDDFEPPGDLESDHLRATHAVVAAQDGRSPADTLHDWRNASARLRLALSGRDAPDMGDPVPFHGLPYRWGSLLVARCLEVWTHSDDIRRAIGRPLVDPDAARLALMTDLAVRTLPLRLAATSDVADTTGTMRIVLTGPGGGVWRQPLGGEPEADEPDVRLVADAVGFCRLSAGRLSAVDLDARVDGDAALGAAILTASAAFAV